MDAILILVLVVLCMFFLGMTLTITLRVLRLEKYINDIELTKLKMNIKPNKEDFEIIDAMITEEVNKYHLTINEPNMVEYMGDESIVEMEKYILKKVLETLSPVHLEKLKYIYNANKLEDIIYEKVRLAVIAYSSDLNSMNNK